MVAKLSFLETPFRREPWMSGTGAVKATVDHQQLTVLNALIALTARARGRAEFSVARDLANAFAVASPRCLSPSQYPDALTWLDRTARGSRA